VPASMRVGRSRAGAHVDAAAARRAVAARRSCHSESRQAPRYRRLGPQRRAEARAARARNRRTHHDQAAGAAAGRSPRPQLVERVLEEGIVDGRRTSGQAASMWPEVRPSIVWRSTHPPGASSTANSWCRQPGRAGEAEAHPPPGSCSSTGSGWARGRRRRPERGAGRSAWRASARWAIGVGVAPRPSSSRPTRSTGAGSRRSCTLWMRTDASSERTCQPNRAAPRRRWSPPGARHGRETPYGPLLRCRDPTPRRPGAESPQAGR